MFGGGGVGGCVCVGGGGVGGGSVFSGLFTSFNCQRQIRIFFFLFLFILLHALVVILGRFALSS